MTQASIDEANERSEARQCSDGVEVYIRGPGWPSAATENDAPMNPWSKEHWNLTEQGRIYKHDPAQGLRMAQAAGHRDVLTSRRENAK